MGFPGRHSISCTIIRTRSVHNRAYDSFSSSSISSSNSFLLLFLLPLPLPPPLPITSVGQIVSCGRFGALRRLRVGDQEKISERDVNSNHPKDVCVHIHIFKMYPRYIRCIQASGGIDPLVHPCLR